MIKVAPDPASTTTASNDLDHIYCCDPDLALCGTDISTHQEVDLDDVDCLVCQDLEEVPCPRCGA